MSKECTKCGETKELEEFPYDKTYNRYKSYCKECGRAMCRAYKANNRKKIAKYNKMYKAENKDDISVYNHNYNKENRTAIQKRQNRTRKERRKNDPNFFVATTLRTRLCDYILSSGKKSADIIEKILGCEWNEFALYFEYLFDEEMTWKNYGKYWTVDHVNPCCNFDLTNEENQLVCFHWSNLRPIVKLTNQKKTGKVIDEEIVEHDELVKHFLKTILPEENEKYTQLVEI